MMLNSKVISYLEAIFAVIVWGASFVATKIALHYVVPTTLVWMRFAMGVVVLGLAVGLTRQFSLPKGGDWVYFALLGFLGITFHQWLQSTALVTTQASTTSWIVASSPIFMAILGFIFLKEYLVWHQIAGILIAAVGVLVVVSKGDLSSISAGNFGSPGDLLILISALNWAVFSTLSRSGLKRHASTLMMFYVMAFGWLFSSVLFLAGPGIKQISQIPLDGWLAILFLGIFCSGIAYIFWYSALKVLPVAQTGAFLYIEPIITAIVAAIILNEEVTFASLIGGFTILFGVWLVNRPKQSIQAIKETI
jgi:drug/metabolite transporter (DMT)-like permease